MHFATSLRTCFQYQSHPDLSADTANHGTGGAAAAGVAVGTGGSGDSGDRETQVWAILHNLILIQVL